MVRAKAIGGKAMQEKEVMAQPRTDTAVLIDACRVLARDVQSGDGVANSALREIADRMEEQEETIRHLRDDLSKAVMVAMDHWKIIEEHRDTIFAQKATIEALRSELVELSAKAMSQEDTIRHLRVEICNASAILMTHLETIKKIQAEVDLLNKRPKR